MLQLSADEQIYVIPANEKSLSTDKQFGKIAFGIVGKIQALSAENSAQLDKIIVSSKQNKEHTALLDLSFTDISFKHLAKSGVTALVVFSDQIPELFTSLIVQPFNPFSVSEIDVFLCPNLDVLQKNDPAKRALWNFMKTYIGG